MLLVPCDPLAPRRPDPHFADEADAARAIGVEVAVVDHDALVRVGGADDGVARVPPAQGAVYRGWMLRSEAYVGFASALARRGVELLTSPSRYRAAHELPGWYAALRDVTPESHWTVPEDGDPLAAFGRACAQLGSGPAVLRDYVKSMKHAWDEAAFIPDVADLERARRVASRFLELRGEDFAGGLVLRRFEHFTSAEARTWWIDGELALVTAHPDTPNGEALAPDLAHVAPRVRALGLPFVTVDLARRDDGVWRVIELGDGQVSDRPRTTPAADLVAALFGRLD